MPHPQRWLTALPDFRGLRVTVMGLGAFGGGAGAARFLAARGARVLVTDLKSESELGQGARELASLPGVRFRLGAHDLEDFTGADLLVVNPAVRRDSPYLLAAVESDVPLTSEMNLFWLHNRGRTIGVTGSNGKSTTTTLIDHMLRASGVRCRMGGNIGRSLLSEVDEIAADEWIVLELSSFQLADLDHLRASPHVAVVTNFAPNHLDRHASLDEYRAAKMTILRWQQPGDTAILNGGDDDVSRWETAGRPLLFGETGDRCAAVVTRDGISAALDGTSLRWSGANHASLVGPHNRANVAAAALAALAVGASPEGIDRGVSEFRGLPHRLQLVGEWQGRRFYNDSKATTPEAALAALAAFDAAQPVILLAGGADKHVDLAAFAAGIARRAKAVALMGETAAALESGIESTRDESRRPTDPPRMRTTSLPEAFAWAVAQSAPGDVVLLSPGCASLDWFTNYEERGRQFAQLVRIS